MKKKLYSSLCLLGIAGTLTKASGADVPASDMNPSAWQKPAWLTELGLGFQQSYNDNILGVSGKGLSPQSSWISTVSPKVGVNFTPLLGDQSNFQTLSLSYTPDFNVFEDASSFNYNAHKIGNTIKGQSGNFSFVVNNRFLYNDGNHQAPIYALNQTSNQNDEFRNTYAHAMPRGWLAQIQDHASVSLRYDWNDFFVRPEAALVYYDMRTDWHNAGAAPWLGYQNYEDRSDLNGGLDLGYKLTSNLSVVLGYRYGHQYQQQFPSTITSDTHFSSGDYQRVLLGLEGKPWSWLNVKLALGPDFRSYNSMAPVNDFHPVKYYGMARITATLTPSQSVTFYYEQWQWVSSTGIVPYVDSTYDLSYHWNATKKLGLTLGGKVLDSNYEGNDPASLRDDIEYSVSGGVDYAVNSNFSAELNYTYALGKNAQDNLTASQEADYREFERQMVSVGLKYMF